MHFHLLDFIRSLAGVAAGGTIGFAFGLLQQAALRRHERRAQQGQLQNAWTLMPGAGARIGYLLIALALVQLVCPLLFVDGFQWIVSLGVVLGYGWTLGTQLRQRLRHSKL